MRAAGVIAFSHGLVLDAGSAFVRQNSENLPHGALTMTMTTMTTLSALACAAALGVDNLLAAPLVSPRVASGAEPLRIEADFVTCSQ